jgi:hypothetical protein
MDCKSSMNNKIVFVRLPLQLQYHDHFGRVVPVPILQRKHTGVFNLQILHLFAVLTDI